jgi:hypothetical protein
MDGDSRLLRNRTLFTLLRGEMEAEMFGLFLEPRYEVGSVSLFVVVLTDIFVSCAGIAGSKSR